MKKMKFRMLGETEIQEMTYENMDEIIGKTDVLTVINPTIFDEIGEGFELDL